MTSSKVYMLLNSEIQKGIKVWDLLTYTALLTPFCFRDLIGHWEFPEIQIKTKNEKCTFWSHPYAHTEIWTFTWGSFCQEIYVLVWQQGVSAFVEHAQTGQTDCESKDDMLFLWKHQFYYSKQRNRTMSGNTWHIWHVTKVTILV